MDIDFSAFSQTNLERFFQLAAAVIVGYEFILQFGNEVEFFWKSRWSLSRCLFIWNRYYSLAYNIGNAVVFLHKEKSGEVSMRFFYWQDFGSVMQYITTQVILQLRLYAMYANSKKLLAFFVALTLTEIGVMAVLFGVPKQGLVATNNPAPGLFICADADPPHVHWIAYVPATMLISETIYLGLALNKAWEHYRSRAGGQILPWLVKESVLYFAAIFTVHVINQVIWLVNHLTLNELFTGISFAVPAVLANKLLISVRSKLTENEMEYLPHSQRRKTLTQRAVDNSPLAVNAVANDYELTDLRRKI